MAILTPGQYIARRRAAAGLSIEDVATQIATLPRLGEIDRIAWLDRIETDVSPVTFDVFAVLTVCVPMDPVVLRELIALADAGSDTIETPRLCRTCACSEFDPCHDEHGATCGWAEQDLCTSCAAPSQAAA